MGEKVQKTRISAEQIQFERLKVDHDVSNFESYEQELVDFLQEDALDNQKKQISVTYLCFLRTDELIGYVTLSDDRIKLEGGLRQRFLGKGIPYRALPALKIGRLCVDNKFIRRGVGTLIMAFATNVAENIFSDYSGCRFVVLDAKRNEENDVVRFYQRIGFKIIREKKKGNSPMYLDLVNNLKFSI